ncbi:MAG: hypothetical protein K8T89_08930 [Planctomycetes bacterium]|nr:hypothetical protein [Planctomycetota bacterium]
MLRSRQLHGALLILALTAIVVSAQDKADPEPASIPRGFRMFVVADGRYPVKDEHNRVGKLHCPVTEHGLNTTIGVFVRGVPAKDTDAGVIVLKKLQELAAKYRDKRLGAFIVFLALNKDYNADDTRDLRITEISNIAKAAAAPLVTIGLAEATIDGTEPAPQVKAWNLGVDDDITVVFYHRFKIIKRWSLKKDAAPDDLLKDLEKEAAGLLGRKKIDLKN